MEAYQTAQNRGMQTIAVINQHAPTIAVGGKSVADLTTAVGNISLVAADRDAALTAFDTAGNAENLGFLALRTMILGLGQAAKADLDDDNSAEAALLDLLAPSFSITPATTELALKRAGKLIPVLVKINAYNAAQVPPRAEVTAGGKSLADLQNAVTSQPALEQALDNADTAARDARNSLAASTHELDRMNKRFFARLQAEARTNPVLAAALAQIETETDNLPGTLSIKALIQGGASTLHVLISYINGTGENADERYLEWMIEGVDTDFTNSVAADLSGNQIGPFLVGQTLKIRTRTVNAGGSRTSAVRTLVIVQA